MEQEYGQELRRTLTEALGTHCQRHRTGPNPSLSQTRPMGTLESESPSRSREQRSV